MVSEAVATFVGWAIDWTKSSSTAGCSMKLDFSSALPVPKSAIILLITSESGPCHLLSQGIFRSS